jgi:biopolymer transport protein ExbB/TolQ
MHQNKKQISDSDSMRKISDDVSKKVANITSDKKAFASNALIIPGEKPFHRLYFNYLQFIFGMLFIIGAVVFSKAFRDFMYALLTSGNITAVMTQVMLACFFIGLYLNIREMFIWHLDLKKLIKFEGALTEDSLNDFEKLLSTVKGSLTNIIKDFRNFKQKQNLNGDPARDYIEILIEKNNGIHKLLGYLAASLPMLGLMGTLIGLSQSVKGLEQISATAATDFSEGLELALTGIGTAFYTTLVGVICMLALKYFNMVTQQVKTAFFADTYKLLRFKLVNLL